MKRVLDYSSELCPFQTPNKSSSNTANLNPLSTFRNKLPLEASLASPLCTPHRTGKKLPPLLVNSGQTSSRPRRAAAIKADERIQQIRHDEPDENVLRDSPRILSARSEEIFQEPVEFLIDHIERKLKFDDDDDEDISLATSQGQDDLLQQCMQLHDRLAYAPNAKLMRYLAEYLILLSGDRDPWLIASLIVEIQAIGFRYNALCIYQRKQR